MLYDFEFHNHGSVCILVPRTAQANDWCEEKLAEHQTWAGGIVVERRYADNVLDGIDADGLTVAL